MRKGWIGFRKLVVREYVRKNEKLKLTIYSIVVKCKSDSKIAWIIDERELIDMIEL